jgi:hypothetical protein
MTETVQTACQVIILDCIVVAFGIRTSIKIYILCVIGTLVQDIDRIMYIYGRNIVQYGAVFILNLTGPVGVTTVVFIRITVNNDLWSGRHDRSRLLI